MPGQGCRRGWIVLVLLAGCGDADGGSGVPPEARSTSPTRTIDVGAGAHGVVGSDDGSRAYVTNIASATVSVVDTATRTVVETVPVGERPNGIAHWRVTGGMP